MNDLAVVHKTLNSASRGYATAENRTGFLRGVQYKKSSKHWSWNPPKGIHAHRKVRCRTTSGRFVKLEDFVRSDVSGV